MRLQIVGPTMPPTAREPLASVAEVALNRAVSQGVNGNSGAHHEPREFAGRMLVEDVQA